MLKARILKILRITGIVMAAIIVGCMLSLAVFYVGLFDPPQIIKDLPFIGQVLTEDEEGQVSAEFRENDRLREKIAEAKYDISKLEEENAQLQTRLGLAEKERDDLKALNKTLEAQNVQFKQLAEYYGNMKVKNAAAIMAELDDETNIGILSNMGSETAAAVMGQLDPGQAAVLTKKMLQVKGGE